MKKRKREKSRLTIEKHLEQLFFLNTHNGERYEILWHAWCNNKRWLIELLQITLSSFPTYSKHDESHASTVLANIEMILGEKRIRELSASDCFMILHTVYIHDIGMVITHSDREDIVKNDKFLEMVEQLEKENDFVFRKAVKALKQTNYDYEEGNNKDEQMKKLYTDKLKVYYALLHLIANYRRTEHGDFSEKRLTDWTLEFDKLGGGFSMAGIPQRIFLHIAKCAGLHTQPFEKIMELPQEDNGYVGDYIHPRFVAVLLQLGDILDMDNDRFHPLTKECMGVLPELSERHFEKHQSIRQLYIRSDIISIAADCQSQDALRLVRKECDTLKGILREAGYNWMLICPRNFSGALPTINSVKLSLKGVQIPEELVTTQFHISQKKAFAILEGSNVYEDRFVFLREFLQNAIDASKMQYWQDCIRTKGYYKPAETLKSMGPDELSQLLSMNAFPIEIEMEVVKRDEDFQEFKITKEDLESDNKNWEYGVKVKIQDFGTGIDKQSILDIAKVGNSRKREQYVMQSMPEWLKPTAEFGIGLQSAFILADTFKCRTFLRSNEGYEITFSSVKSTYYEGYINVEPLKISNQYGEEVYGTCFEVFVPEQRKLPHELYPLAWDRKDYFGENYEKTRSIRHAAELLTQMVFYLDSQIGEQLFPINLKVIENPHVEVMLDENKLSRIRNKGGMGGEKTNKLDWYVENFSEYKEELYNLFGYRKWKNSGLSWILNLNSEQNDEDIESLKTEREQILIERSENSIAMLDCRDGCFYFWEKTLCVLCTVNMKNFFLMEQREKESIDKQCEKISQGVEIYYKGIFLEEIELPDLGNEMLELIDIKGKLPREFINLSRRGFTEKGKRYFYEHIYAGLQSSIHKILTGISRNQSHKLIRTTKAVLEERLKLLNKVSKFKNENMFFYDFIINVNGKYMDLEKDILVRFKENMISLAMIAFFAQKEVYISESPRAYSEKKRECWSELIKIIGAYAGQVQNKIEKESTLFHIRISPTVSLDKDIQVTGTTSKYINFLDIFSPENQFMIVSRRENIHGPWEQFLVSIWSETDRNKGSRFIELYKEYLALNDSWRKNELYDELQSMGEASVEIGRLVAKNSTGKETIDSMGNSSQQYFIKWMTKYIPTIAMFMSEDGNVRINIIHGQVFPYIFVNMHYKEQVLKRIMEYENKYMIQRFSVPAWQNTKHLSLNELPYALYFVKRGYASNESFKKVIFPFDGGFLHEIRDVFSLEKVRKKKEELHDVFELYDIKQWINNLSEREDDIFDRYIITLKDKTDEEKSKYISASREFQKLWKDGERKTERILLGIRLAYRQFIAHIMNEEKPKGLLERKKFTEPEELHKIRDTFEKNIINILIEVLVDYYYDESAGALQNMSSEECEEIFLWWNYIINREYIYNYSEVVMMKEEYMKKLEDETTEQYQVNKRILNYIYHSERNPIKEEYLWEYWKQYINDWFEVMISIELGEYYEPETLITEIPQIKKMIDNI